MKVIIIEDINYEIDLIKSLLKKLFPQVEVIGQADNVVDGVKLITSHKPDFILMDIEIMGGTSYDILNQIQKLNIPIDFEIIFLTGNRKFDYATMAFAYSALDFLTKPIDPILFENAINKAIERSNPQQYLNQIQLFMDLVRSPDNKNSKLAVHKIGGVISFVQIDQIVYLEADKEVTRFVFKNEEEIIAARNLGQYDQLLVNNHRFFSISNSILINLDELDSYDHSEKIVTMSNQKRLYASRRGGQDLKNYINKNIRLAESKSESLINVLKNIFSNRGNPPIRKF
jgi:two-component system, LytTR family, response regulator